ncbi:CoxG family protein [Burkholderia gladioli]|uniref:CoxG family protein n=1 Tax=Burkholderia gladioli TaxID=28095 RepID=UPI001640EA99|nr:SRPBCC domain-containing protein [Burkholderia gladioli]
MELNDALRVALAPSKVWAALHDLALLRASVEHCEALTRLSQDDYTLVLTVPLGPLRARYEVRVHLQPTSGGRPRRNLVFIARTEGGGLLRGQLDVRLSGHRVADGLVTRIHYTIRATAAGPLAELPPRQVEQGLRRLADDFFSEFAASLLAKFGLAPNLATAEPRHRHVFLRPDGLSAALRRARERSAFGGALAGRAGGAMPDGRTSGVAVPAWVWLAVVALVVVGLGVARWLGM